jgi:4-amino-4-deoxy-L-arabinose transferase-like glycosyltransferase
VLRRETNKSAIVFSRNGGDARLIEIVSRANHLLPFGIINALMGNQHRFLLAASFLYLALANLIWIARDTRPPYWDMAVHATGALRIHDAFASHGIRAVSLVPSLTGSYPPFYHSIVALLYSVLGRTVGSARWANLPAIALLLLATYGIGRSVLRPFAAATAAAIANFYPILLWLSRETMIDYWLTSMVALAIWLLLRTKEFTERRWSVVFGIACGLGMLTKWTFVFFVMLPALWFARKNVKNAAIAACIAAVIASYWYAFAAQALLHLLNINSAQSVSEGDPARFSLQAIVFYFRVLEGSQLFLPLFIAFIAGLILLVLNFNRNWIPILLWAGGGWLGMLLFQNKDPRYTAPLLPAVALITSLIFHRKEFLAGLLIPILLFQHYLVSFGVPQLPPAIVLARGGQGPISYDWNVYTQRYFGWGPPARENWQIDHVMQAIGASRKHAVRLGMVPDIPRFDTSAFEFYIALEKLPVTMNRLWTFDTGAIANNDYILASEKDHEFEPGSGYTGDLRTINLYLSRRPEAFHVVDQFVLPNGDLIRLYKVGTT